MVANPEATVNWYKNEEPIEWNVTTLSDVSNTVHHVLHMDNLNDESLGTYTCRAVNKIGAHEAAMNIEGNKDHNAFNHMFIC